MPIYRKGDDQFGLREAAQEQRAHDYAMEIGNVKDMSADDQSGFTGARMAFTPIVGGVTANMRFAPVSGTELAKHKAKMKSGAINYDNMKNNDHKVDPTERYEKGAY
jgi:hypothetical protein